MTHMRAGIVVACCGALLAAACGSAPPRPSPAHEAAVQLNRNAQTAYERGELTRSLEDYQRALQANRAIEHIDGIAAELTNIAALQWELGRSREAHAAVDELLVAPAVPFTDAQRAEAAYRKAYFHLDADEQAAAQRWLEISQSSCDRTRCVAEGKIGNLRARLALARADHTAALAVARAALAANRRHGDRTEEANSLRLIGDAALRRHELDSAYAAYAEALEIDKALGLPSKIARDLIGIGESRRAQGHAHDAVGYFRRAQSVALAAGDTALARLAVELAGQTGP